MVEKRAGLTPLQIEVLEWIKAGQPPETFADTEDLTYRSHARWLEKFGLVSISGSGDTWRVKLTDRGRRWPEVPPTPAPLRRVGELDGSRPRLHLLAHWTERARQVRALLSQPAGARLMLGTTCRLLGCTWRTGGWRPAARLRQSSGC